MNTKKKHGTAFPSQKKSEAEELGKRIKRKVINKAKDEESAEEIKEYVYPNMRYTDTLIDTGLIDNGDYV